MVNVINEYLNQLHKDLTDFYNANIGKLKVTDEEISDYDGYFNYFGADTISKSEKISHIKSIKRGRLMGGDAHWND